MSPTRRQVVSAIAAGAAVPASVTAAGAQQEDDDQEFSPEISINSNNLVATIGERDDDVDPDTVTIYTADGSVHEFDGAAEDEWEAGEAFDVGYTYDDSRARLENWHGIIEQVSATKDGERVSQTNDSESTLEVSCSLWKTPDEPPTEFTALSEGARKQHWNRGDQDLSEDQRQYGSPGRPLWTVAERHPDIEMRVDFLECDPETEKALWFDCTSVTVTEDELNQGEDRIRDVQLTFDDDTTEHPPGTADEADNGAYELPVTLSGSGENEGKVIKKLHFKVERGEYTYWNLEADQCSVEGEEADGGNDSGGDEDGPQSSERTETPTEGGPSGDDTGSDDSTATPEATDDGSGSGGGSSDVGASGTDADDGADGGSGGEDTETPTPQSVEVGNGTTDAAGDTTTEGATAADTATATENASGGAGNGTGGGAGEPTEGLTGEDQPGMGFVSALGGLLGLGELARRRLDADAKDADVDADR